MAVPHSLVNWLECLLKERISSSLRLSCDFDAWKLTVEGSEKHLSILSDWDLWQSVIDPEVGLWDCEAEGFVGALNHVLPIISVRNHSLFLYDNVNSRFQYDVLSFIWWVLSRKEESASTARDQHCRFPFTASHAHRHGYLLRPVVDEWIEILRQLIMRTWPNLPLVSKEYKVVPTHDVDVPSYYSLGGMKKYLHTVAVDIVRNKKYVQSLMSPITVLRYVLGQRDLDPFHTYDFLMDCSETIGVQSTFYFKAGATNLAYDSPYNLAHPTLKKLLRRIVDRGHRVGLHPSFECYNNLRTLSGEVERFRDVLNKAKTESELLYSRMHYLRLNWPKTFIKLAECGVSHDSSMGYADAAGFRCGTCHPYTAFDPVQMYALPVTVSPLIFMEATVLTKDIASSQDMVKHTGCEVMSACKAVNGEFVLLWHNSNLSGYKKFYQRFLKSCSAE